MGGGISAVKRGGAGRWAVTRFFRVMEVAAARLGRECLL